MAPTPVVIDRKRIAELAEREEQRLEKETPRSHELFVRASKSPRAMYSNSSDNAPSVWL